MQTLVKSKETILNEWIENHIESAVTQMKNADDFEHVKFQQGKIRTLEILKQFISNGYKEIDY